jgi:hypothetical protein
MHAGTRIMPDKSPEAGDNITEALAHISDAMSPSGAIGFASGVIMCHGAGPAAAASSALTGFQNYLAYSANARLDVNDVHLNTCMQALKVSGRLSCIHGCHMVAVRQCNQPALAAQAFSYLLFC